MIIFLPNRKSSGYTIVEIILTIGILIVIFSLAMANYRGFTLNRSLDSARLGIISDLKLAQEYSISGKIPAGCVNLQGYLFSINYDPDPDSNFYTVTADCATDVNIKTVYLSGSVKNVRFTGAQSAVLFEILGNGTNIASGNSVTYSIEQITTGTTREIIVSSGGEIR